MLFSLEAWGVIYLPKAREFDLRERSLGRGRLVGPNCVILLNFHIEIVISFVHLVEFLYRHLDAVEHFCQVAHKRLNEFCMRRSWRQAALERSPLRTAAARLRRSERPQSALRGDAPGV